MFNIEYSKYTEMGGCLNEDTFNKYKTVAVVKCNYITFGRLNKLEDIPSEVYLFVASVIDYLYETSQSSEGGQLLGVSSYSNGIESFTYDTEVIGKGGAMDKLVNAGIKQKALEYLADYPQLLYRGFNRVHK